MAWGHLSINRPHLVYIILGGFTSLFMLCSSIIKERLYIGEATVATAVGIIFGPHAAGLIDPLQWGNTDQITLEFARIVLVVQCFAVGVELPKAYMERHWRSVVLLLVPVMTFGWLITSLFIWAMFHQHANWLDCLCMAACVTATDPVLASSVVGKGKFAKRVPKHLRDLLSAESGCNDGMAFPFIYLALYIIKDKGYPNEFALHWFCVSILYECIFGAIYGFTIGYIARRLIRYAHEKDWIDRESFLVFYFVLALFCAGSGSLLGMDDLLIGFACGVGFSNDGWFTEKTEETHVSNVIDLLLNLTFFVYFGTIIPWDHYDSGVLGLEAWKLVIIAFLVLFFRRIPIMILLKPLIPDIKTWREALFAGHFGPIGVGAIFVAILARAELETDGTTPLAHVPGPGAPHRNIMYLIWPITTFLVLTSIIVHGSSVAVFTLGKHINTLQLTMSYTQASEQGPNWMDRLPRIQSRSKSSMSMALSDSEMDEKPYPPGMLPPIGKPGAFLRRQREEDNPSRVQSRSSSRHRHKGSKNWEFGRGPGGPISQTAIAPRARPHSTSPPIEQTGNESDLDITPVKSASSPSLVEKPEHHQDQPQDAKSPGEIFEEGGETVFEDEEGNVLGVERERSHGSKRETEEIEEGRRLMHDASADENNGIAPHIKGSDTNAGHGMLEKIKSAEEQIKAKVEHKPEESQESQESQEQRPERPGKLWRSGLQKMSRRTGFLNPRNRDTTPKEQKVEEKKTHGAARAYQYGNTIVIEDEDGEVIKKYDIPAPGRKQGTSREQNVARQRIGQMSKYLGLGNKDDNAQVNASGPSSEAGRETEDPEKKAIPKDEDELVRFTIDNGGRRMSKADFIQTIQKMDPKRRAQTVENSNAPEPVKQEARKEAREQAALSRRPTNGENGQAQASDAPTQPTERNQKLPEIKPSESSESASLRMINSKNEEIPFHDISAELRSHQLRSSEGETAAERRRRRALQNPAAEDDSDDDGTERVPPRPPVASSRAGQSGGEAGETAAERRRREGALGIHKEVDTDSEDEDQPRQSSQRPGIRFAEQPARQPRQSTLRWGSNRGR